MSLCRLLLVVAVGGALSPAAAGAEQRRTLSVSAEVISSCTVAMTVRGQASAACGEGEVVSISRAKRRRGGPSEGKPTENGRSAAVAEIEVVTLTF